ncbi:universal stress protein [Streptomyces sp. ID05-04B]|uniref:universal stress protein n=1 Tax=unclassified Streptomyces TaxID=2593676 RepID=UPI000D1A9853|nr:MULTISPECIES: universal stress protein [unclassified Streptomyces]AVV45708.1 universal stress protein [Streptomyces sp. P3]MDX5563255.1 universal stress protein [Streptomyces sp. ID05-04B]
MELPLVVGVDGSDSSLLAVDWAVDEAARHGLQLRLLHAFRWERYERTLPSFTTGRHAGEVMARNIVASCAQRAGLRNPEVKVSEEVVPDDAVSALLRAAPDAFALIVGERGRGEVSGLLLGSVSLTVAARAVCPVVVVRGAEPDPRGSLGRVVVGVGEAADRAGAVRFAAREAQARGCALTAVRAWRRPAHEHGDDPLVVDDTAQAHDARASAELEDALREAVREHPDLSVHRRAVEGPAHRVLLDAAADADLVVVGAVRRHGHFGLQLGRVAHTLLHHSACPVAVVPQRV